MSAAQLSTFSVAGHLFGVEVRVVQEVIRYQPMTRVPLAPAALAGLINLRGQVIPAVDLRRRLGFPDRAADELAMDVIVRTRDAQVRPDGGDVTVGCVTVTGEWQGNVLLACPAQLARMAASAMFNLPATQLDDDQVADALGELTNMIGGNVKSLIPGPSRLSMPTVTVGASSTVPMPRAALLSTVSLACEGLPLTVSVWRMRADRPAG